jgi:thiol:disulfide interchange protein DsbC
MVYFRMQKMVRLSVFLVLACLSVAFFLFGDAEGFASRFGPDGDCAKCHVLTVEEANSIIKALNPEIRAMGVNMGPMDGVWEVVIEARGKKGIAYVDFSKEHIITGSVIKLSTRENLTNLKLYDLSKIDPAIIPLEEALVMGDKDAKYKVVVFDDPD